MRKKERFVLGKRTFRSQKSKHFVLRIIQKFEWNLKDNNDYIINGTVRGQILFESNDCFYLYSDETLDPETGENIKGEFRDIYDRKK